MSKKSKKKVGIRISSEPDSTGLRKPELIPLRLIFLSDLLPHGRSTEPQVRVDKNNFNETMQRLCPRVTLDVKNFVSNTPPKLELDLSFPTLNTFRPEGIVEQIPSLKQLLSIRTLVSKAKDGAIALAEFRDRLAETGVDQSWAEQLYGTLTTPPKPKEDAQPGQPPPSQASTGKLGSLLDMIDIGEASGSKPSPPRLDTPSTPLNALLQATSGEDSGGTIEKSAAQLIITELDEVLNRQVNEVLHHPDFQQLESSWRSLKFLVDRIDFRKGIVLDTLPAQRNDLQQMIRDGVILQKESDIPPAVVILDYDFEVTERDIQLLEEICQSGAEHQFIAIASSGAAFFGVANAAELGQLPPLWQYFSQPQYVTWNAFREKPESSHLALALPRFLMRSAYGPDWPVKTFSFLEENGTSAKHLWGKASVAAGVAIAHSYAETSWPCHVKGTSRMIESLPLWGSGRVRMPLEVLIGDEKSVELASSGFMILTGRANSDAVFFRSAPTVHQPERYEDGDLTEKARMYALLAVRLAATRLAHQIFSMQQEISSLHSPSTLKKEITERVRVFMKATGVAFAAGDCQVEVQDSSEAANTIDAEICISLPEEIVGQAIELTMTLQVRR